MSDSMLIKKQQEIARMKAEVRSTFEERKKAMSDETMLARKKMEKKDKSPNQANNANYYNGYFDWKYRMATAPLTENKLPHVSIETMHFNATAVKSNTFLADQLKKDFSTISGRSVKKRMKKVKKMHNLMQEFSDCAAEEENRNQFENQIATWENNSTLEWAQNLEKDKVPAAQTPVEQEPSSQEEVSNEEIITTATTKTVNNEKEPELSDKNIQSSKLSPEEYERWANAHKNTLREAHLQRLKSQMKRVINRVKMMDISREYQHEFIKAYGKKDAVENEKLAQINYEFAVQKGTYLADYEQYFLLSEEQYPEMSQYTGGPERFPEVTKLRKEYSAKIRKLISENKAEQMKYLKAYDKVLKKNGVSPQEAVVNLNEEKIKDLEEINKVNPVIQDLRTKKYTENVLLGPYMRMAIGLTLKNGYTNRYQLPASKLYHFMKKLPEDANEALQRLFNDKQDKQTIAKNLVELLWVLQVDIIDAGFSKEDMKRSRTDSKLRNIMYAFLLDHKDIHVLFKEKWDKKQKEANSFLHGDDLDDIKNYINRDPHADIDKYRLNKEDDNLTSETVEKDEDSTSETVEKDDNLTAETIKNEEVSTVETKSTVTQNDKLSFSQAYNNRSAEYTPEYTKAVSATPIIKVDQKSFQPKGSNRCWSYAISNMLKSRGINVEPEEIAKKALTDARIKDFVKKDINNFETLDINDVKDIFKDYLKGNFNLYSSFVFPSEEKDGKFKTKMKLMEIINHALNDGSTVGINLPNEAHYVTIVGMIADKDNETILYKDSRNNGSSAGSNFIHKKKLDVLINSLYAGGNGVTNLYWTGKTGTKFMNGDMQ